MRDQTAPNSPQTASGRAPNWKQEAPSPQAMASTPLKVSVRQRKPGGLVQTPPHPVLLNPHCRRPPPPHPSLRLLKVTQLAVTYLRDPGLKIANPQASRLLGADY